MTAGARIGYIGALMSAPLPDRLDPWLAVRDGRVFAGEILPGHLPRLEALAGARWPGGFELHFGLDEGGQAVVTGRLRLTLLVTCQRCMGEMALAVDAGVAWGLLHDDCETARLSGDWDPVVVGDGLVSPWELIEDELLLAVPHVPRHALDVCPAAGYLADAPSEQAGGQDREAEPENPFAVLAALKSGGPGDDTNGA